MIIAKIRERILMFLMWHFYYKLTPEDKMRIMRAKQRNKSLKREIRSKNILLLKQWPKVFYAEHCMAFMFKEDGQLVFVGPALRTVKTWLNVCRIILYIKIFKSKKWSVSGWPRLVFGLKAASRKTGLPEKTLIELTPSGGWQCRRKSRIVF